MFRAWAENEKKEKIELTDTSFFDYVEIDGLLPPQVTINTTKVTNHDGSIYNSARAENRSLQIIIGIAKPIETNRQRLYRYFKTKKVTRIYFQNENRDLIIDGYVEGFDGSLFDEAQQITISLNCLDPYFKSRNESVMDMAQVVDLFEFPFSIEEEGMPFSEIYKELKQSIYYTGDVETGMIIEISASGEVINPRIYNVDTREYFGLNITMQAGDLIRINTNSLKKKVELVRNGTTTNIINNIQKGNKWFKLYQGDNLFTYVCDSGEQFLNFKFIYSNSYEGV